MARSPSLAHRTVLRAKALLLAADGVAIYETARQVGVSSNSVRSWRRRFESEGLAGVGKIAKGGDGGPGWQPTSRMPSSTTRCTSVPTKVRRSGAPGRWPSVTGSARTPWPGSGASTI